MSGRVQELHKGETTKEREQRESDERGGRGRVMNDKGEEMKQERVMRGSRKSDRVEGK